MYCVLNATTESVFSAKGNPLGWPLEDNYGYFCDQRDNGYVFLASGPLKIITTVLMYLFVVLKLGPRLMQSRKPLEIITSIRIYNLLMIAANMWLLKRALLIVDNGRSFFNCKGIQFDPSVSNEVASLSDHFLLTRVADFLDTLFFVMRKKQSHISFLHVFHHSYVPLCVYLFSRLSPITPVGMAFPFINSFVHVVMYSYYFMATFPQLRPYLWWKRYLTAFQMAQFVSVLFYNIYTTIFFKASCGHYELNTLIGSVVSATIFLGLFARFYKRAYMVPVANKERSKEFYDGQEKYIPPLSMAESFSQLIAKIDFNEDGDEPGPSSQVIASAQRTLWPFEGVKSKLRDALTEICVLHDVLKIANHKVKIKEPGKEEREERKYLEFDVVTQEPNPEQSRSQLMMLIAKKRALQTASQILTSGAANLRTPLVDKVYSELLCMRQNWRLRKNGNVIMGDLSFRTIGSRYTGAKFEVTKNDRPGPQALKVKVPDDLDGYSQIHVAIHKGDRPIADVPLMTDVPTATTWQEKLEQAQNVLFCKELFAQLAKDAVQSQYYMPTTVTGNQIVVALFPDTKLSISLLHKDQAQQKREKKDRQSTPNHKDVPDGKHNPVLEQSLHQLLRDFHVYALRKFQCRDIPKHAGCEAHDRQTIAAEPKQESLLKQIKLQAQHIVTRQQTMDLIDSFAREIKDPLIVSHWFCLNSPFYSSVRVNIVSQNYDILGRTPLVIRIGPQNVYADTKNGINVPNACAALAFELTRIILGGDGTGVDDRGVASLIDESSTTILRGLPRGLPVEEGNLGVDGSVAIGVACGSVVVYFVLGLMSRDGRLLAKPGRSFEAIPEIGARASSEIRTQPLQPNYLNPTSHKVVCQWNHADGWSTNLDRTYLHHPIQVRRQHDLVSSVARVSAPKITPPEKIMPQIVVPVFVALGMQVAIVSICIPQDLVHPIFLTFPGVFGHLVGSLVFDSILDHVPHGWRHDTFCTSSLTMDTSKSKPEVVEANPARGVLNETHVKPMSKPDFSSEQDVKSNPQPNHTDKEAPVKGTSIISINPKIIDQLNNGNIDDYPSDDESDSEKRDLDIGAPDSSFFLGSLQHSAPNVLKAKKMIESISKIVDFNEEPAKLKYREGVNEDDIVSTISIEVYSENSLILANILLDRIMSATEQMRAMLDQLMGTARDGQESQKLHLHFTDPRVCKSFLLDCCPHDVLASTRMDLGSCSKVHDPALRADYESASKERDYLYELDALDHLQSFVNDADKKTDLAKKKLAETQEVLTSEATAQLNKIHDLTEQIGKKLAESEKESAEGNAEAGAKCLEEVEKIKKEKSLAEKEYHQSMPSSINQQHKLRVCEVCSAYLGISDNDRRLADHFGGKLHLGFITIRERLEDLKRVVEEKRRKGLLPDPKSSYSERNRSRRNRRHRRRRRGTSRSRSRSRERSSHRDYDSRGDRYKKSYHHRSRSRERDRNDHRDESDRRRDRHRDRY
ncbi:putative RNA-binding protein Luc7-like 1 [Fragariocoptes setiger]|uniref:Mediator of RNA polymerase II transcription subunit 17 n=1 Tax=Fragariocoptes setiger TaxID=1670756 RepID=A0ABQ7SD91_9ACAR|nr:putative RNA-binding protein Luc7-like 1 [Fragariocoptes setiger]